MDSKELDQEYINRQFNSLRAQLLSLLEEEVEDTELLKRLKPRVKTITSYTCDRFTIEFGDKESIVQYRNRNKEGGAD